MSGGLELLPTLLCGLSTTCTVFAGAALVGLPLALLAGQARRSGGALGWLATGYIEMFRGTSTLVQLYWGYFVLPLAGLTLSPLAVAIGVLGMNTGAYGAEIARGCLNAVPRGQLEAATALGLGPFTTWWRVVLPQAAPTMVPPGAVLLVELLKGTSLVSLVTLADLTWQAQLLRAETLRSPAIYAWLLAIYLVLALALTAGARWLERRLARHRGSHP